MCETFYGEARHQQINEVVCQNKGKLSGPVLRNLKKLKMQIHLILGGEENYTVFLYISDELDKPIQFGTGDNELVIDVEEDGIDFAWTKKTWWKFAKDLFKDAANAILNCLYALWGGVKAIAGIPLIPIDWVTKNKKRNHQ